MAVSTLIFRTRRGGGQPWADCNGRCLRPCGGAYGRTPPAAYQPKHGRGRYWAVSFGFPSGEPDSRTQPVRSTGCPTCGDEPPSHESGCRGRLAAAHANSEANRESISHAPHPAVAPGNAHAPIAKSTRDAHPSLTAALTRTAVAGGIPSVTA